MNDALRHLMHDLGPLTRSGRLAEATALIQQHLQQALVPAGPHGASRPADVIDVEARVVDRGTPEPVEVPERFLSGVFGDGAHERPYRLYVPPGAPTRPRPLIVMLHGCTQDPDDFARGTRMNDHARAVGAMVLYPGQTSQANHSRCWNWFQRGDQQRDQGEPAWIAALTLQVLQTWHGDPRRVYIAGLSAGGAMAATLAATHPDLYAAVGVHSGLPHGAAHDLPSALAAMRGQPAATGLPAAASAVPLIVFHGDRDGTVHPCNGERLMSQAGDALHGHGERPTPAAAESFEQGGRRCTRTLLHRPDGEVQAEHWVVHGTAHAWSGGDPSGSHTDPRGPDASAEMLRFFLDHPQPAQRAARTPRAA